MKTGKITVKLLLITEPVSFYNWDMVNEYKFVIQRFNEMLFTGFIAQGY
jgi:hypothetical protein